MNVGAFLAASVMFRSRESQVFEGRRRAATPQSRVRPPGDSPAPRRGARQLTSAQPYGFVLDAPPGVALMFGADGTAVIGCAWCGETRALQYRADSATWERRLREAVDAHRHGEGA